MTKTVEQVTGGAALDRRPLGAIGFRLAHELTGLLAGVSADGSINAEEVDRIKSWLAAAEPYRDVKPFAELARHLDAALADGLITIEEAADLRFVAEKFTTVNPYFDAMRSGLQALMGFCAGIGADRAIGEAEVAGLSEWIETWSHLRGVWPYDECETIVVSILGSSSVEPGVSHLRALADSCPVGGCEVDGTVVGLASAICATDPSIVFPERSFVVTGESERSSRADIERMIAQRGGVIRRVVSKKANYLIVCDASSPHWAFHCYGRKIQQAHELRRAGNPIVIAHERDLWDALA